LNKLIKPDGILVISGPVKVKISDYFGLAKIYHEECDKKAAPQIRNA